jgi:hypothetical protein
VRSHSPSPPMTLCPGFLSNASAPGLPPAPFAPCSPTASSTGRGPREARPRPTRKGAKSSSTDRGVSSSVTAALATSTPRTSSSSTCWTTSIPRGRSTQPSDTFFKSGRTHAEDGRHFAYWQVRLGENQPKRFNIIFDRDLGGRLSHNVCEKYYAQAVHSQVDLASIPDHYDPHAALDRMPLRLSCPESLIPGYGWHMEEYSVHGAVEPPIPYGHDSGIQTAALLAYEGLGHRDASGNRTSGTTWPRRCRSGRESDGAGYFVRRPGGWTRWTYVSDYQHKLPLRGRRQLGSVGASLPDRSFMSGDRRTQGTIARTDEARRAGQTRS